MTELQEDQTCRWELDDSDGAWDGDCGTRWLFENDGPTENNMRYCPYCGKPCTVIEPTEEIDDD